MDTDDELRRMKAIPLGGYLTSQLAFELVPYKSSAYAQVYRRGATTLLVSRAKEGTHDVWVDASTIGSAKPVGGSVIDAAIQFVPGCRSLGYARVELRPLIGRSFAAPARPLKTPEPDRLAVQGFLAKLTPVAEDNAYLMARGLPPELFTDKRLTGRVLQDERGRVVFVDFDSEGPCGAVIRDHETKRMLTGSIKGLWFGDDPRTEAREVLIAEAPIDLLSLLTLEGGEWRADQSLLATGGNLSYKQRDLLCSAIAKLPEGCLIRMAFDADESGSRYAETIETIVAEQGRGDLTTSRDAPSGAKDYNQLLCGVRGDAVAPQL